MVLYEDLPNLKAINVSGRTPTQSDLDGLDQAIGNIMGNPEDFIICLLTRQHSEAEFSQIVRWFADRTGSTASEEWDVLDDEEIETICAYVFKDENLALEFRMRWS